MIYAARLRPGEAFNVSLNPLVAALERRKCPPTQHRAGELCGAQERLTSAMKLFEFRAVQDGVENSQVMAARYVLCTVVDEAVVTTPWGNESEWSKISLPEQLP